MSLEHWDFDSGKFLSWTIWLRRVATGKLSLISAMHVTQINTCVSDVTHFIQRVSFNIDWGSQ